MGKQETIDNLQKQIEELQQQKLYLERWESVILQKNYLSELRKAEAFDRLYDQALEYLRKSIKAGYSVKDGDHYLFEAVITETLGDGFWDITKQFEKGAN